MSTQNQLENGKIAVALRAARTAIGWNQQEFSEKMGVAKSTVARIETLEISAKGEFILRAMRLFREAGVDVDLYRSEGVSIAIKDTAINSAVADLQNEGKRRKDRKTD
jgi:transcriptional regulator with XRE-family HTH domain